MPMMYRKMNSLPRGYCLMSLTAAAADVSSALHRNKQTRILPLATRSRYMTNTATMHSAKSLAQVLISNAWCNPHSKTLNMAILNCCAWCCVGRCNSVWVKSHMLLLCTCAAC